MFGHDQPTIVTTKAVACKSCFKILEKNTLLNDLQIYISKQMPVSMMS